MSSSLGTDGFVFWAFEDGPKPEFLAVAGCDCDAVNGCGCVEPGRSGLGQLPWPVFLQGRGVEVRQAKAEVIPMNCGYRTAMDPESVTAQ
jgi:hypothetical protein